MSKCELNLPAHIELKRFESAEDVCIALSDEIETIVTNAVAARGEASIALSGGRTPIPMFQALSSKALPWDNMTVSLVDDRWVPPTHKDSNEALLIKHLLASNPNRTHFIGFWKPDCDAYSAVPLCNESFSGLPEALDCAVLGMGNDGHTASIFPESEQLQNALDTTDTCCAVTPSTAPHDRMTMSAHKLLASRKRILHLKGEDKLETLKSAVMDDDIHSMPVRLFLNHPLTIYWSP